LLSEYKIDTSFVPGCAVKVRSICPITNEIVEYPSQRHVHSKHSTVHVAIKEENVIYIGNTYSPICQQV
jgi:hypothetical protein